MTGRQMRAARRSSLRPDIDCVKQAIKRVVESLADDPDERRIIAATAAQEYQLEQGHKAFDAVAAEPNECGE